MQSVKPHHAVFLAGTTDRARTRSAHGLEIWQFINILLSALVTGVFWGT